MMMDNQTEEVVLRIQPENSKGGVWVAMGLEEYRIPPLGFGAIRELQDRLSALQGMTSMPSESQMAVVSEIVLMAMKRNYPSITLEEVMDKLDLGNFQAVFNAVLGQSGYREAAPGEAPTTSR